MSLQQQFSVGTKVVYPSHGVGEVIAIEVQTVGGTEVKVYAISFPQDKMVLRVPVNRASSVGLRGISDRDVIEKIYNCLESKAKSGNKMWSRRAQEYEAKINSGDILALTEVVRDLYKNVNSDRSYSEITIYKSALGRLAEEIAILEGSTVEDATTKLVEVLKDKIVAA